MHSIWQCRKSALSCSQMHWNEGINSYDVVTWSTKKKKTNKILEYRRQWGKLFYSTTKALNFANVKMEFLKRVFLALLWVFVKNKCRFGMVLIKQTWNYKYNINKMKRNFITLTKKTSEDRTKMSERTMTLKCILLILTKRGKWSNATKPMCLMFSLTKAITINKLRKISIFTNNYNLLAT